MKVKNYTWNELRRHGVNYDYIITLNKKEDGTLERVDHPITYLNSLFDRLELMFNDDELYDVVDMERAILSRITIEPLSICIPYEYDRKFINGDDYVGTKPITYRIIDQEKTWSSFRAKKENLLSVYKRILTRKEKDLLKRKIDLRASELATQEYHSFIHEEKIKFLLDRIGYLHAYAYKKTYDAISKDVFFISSEEIGWPNHKETGNQTWTYKINEDLNVSLWSNFCYGKSSAFFIRILYKGLQLCPYSEFVTYRYALETDILNYTRKYQLKRTSWDAAADFVMNFCNKAIKDPDNFIREEITYEVKTLVQELTKIVAGKEQYLQSRFNTPILVNNRYSHVANLITFDEYQLANYNKNPHEYELLFRMEKISGALSFVTSLESFSTIFKFIRRVIVKIENLNVEIYPELAASIIPIQEEVERLRVDFLKLSTEYEKIEKRIEYHYNRIETIQKRHKDYQDKEIAKKKYYECHAELTELEKSKSKIGPELHLQKVLLENRKTFLKKLESCKSNIEDYGISEIDF